MLHDAAAAALLLRIDNALLIDLIETASKAHSPAAAQAGSRSQQTGGNANKKKGNRKSARRP
jgi:hypothetical protein